MSSPAFERFLSTAEMLAVFDERAVVQAMLDVEAALSAAQAEVGLIPAAAAAAVAHAARVDRVDAARVVAQSGRAGSLAIPLVKALTAAVAADHPDAAGWVHWGATSQDIIDTALVLLLRRALALIDRDLGTLAAGLLALAERHADAPLLGRTLLQPAQVISFGFKSIAWIAPLVRRQQRLHEAGAAALQLQLGGAVGTLAAMGERGPAVAARMAERLALACPPGAWHTQRDELAALAGELGVLTGALGKVARDVALMAQGELGELAEPSGEGRGGSSAMPHKRNPVASMVALSNALRAPHRVAALLAAMVQEHERGLGNWQAELAEWASLAACAHGAVQALAEVADALQVDGARMRANIDALQGLVFGEAVSMALAAGLGKSGAHAVVEQWSRAALRERRSLQAVAREAVEADPALQAALDGADLAALFDPARPAAHADALAAPQRADLAQRAARLRAAAPWAAWLPPAQRAP